ncbi:MAG: FAD/NAD(P)-binding protein [Gaiellaceae bacterium]
MTAEAAMLPVPYRVSRRTRDTADTWTLELAPGGPATVEPEPGQFAMLYAWGAGEVPISLSGRAGRDNRLVHTIRDVGAVTHALCGLRRGAVLGVRGPFGTTWPLDAADGADVVVVAGGLGLAPLRPAIRALATRRARYGRVAVLYGARTPADLLYPAELERWAAAGLDVHVTVDAAQPGWTGTVGLVPKLLDRVAVDPASTLALACGPEVMMRFGAEALIARGVPAAHTYVSLERAMKCGVGHCGHCQLGPTLVCRDGPVYAWSDVAPLLAVREL